MKYTQLIFVTFASLALAQKWPGDLARQEATTQQEISAAFKNWQIRCEERESKIICKADFTNLEGFRDLTIDGLTPLCQEKGGCGKCKVEAVPLQYEITCEIAAQNNTSTRPQETPKPQETKPQFPPQRDDVNGVDTGPVSPQQMEKLICNQFEDPKANCENVLRQCVFEQKDNLRNFVSPKDFWQAVGECASKVLTLKEH